MQAREEELLRSKVAAQRGRDSRRGRRGGGRVEYRGGARGPPDGRRGLEDPHDLKLNGGGKEGGGDGPRVVEVVEGQRGERNVTFSNVCVSGFVVGGGADGLHAHRTIEALDPRSKQWDTSLAPMRSSLRDTRLPSVHPWSVVVVLLSLVTGLSAVRFPLPGCRSL